MSTIIKVLSLIITLLPSAALSQQFTPQQMLDVMTKSPENRDVRVGDHAKEYPHKHNQNLEPGKSCKISMKCL